MKEKGLMEHAKAGKVDTTEVNALIKDYITYSDSYPNDTMGAEYLFKAADFYRYMHQPVRCIDLYSKVYDRYPSFSRRPYALFLQGFILENEVKNNTGAKTIYEKFLKEYPTHPIAKDVQITLNNLGKSPEELLEEFQEKAKRDSAMAAKK